MIIKRLHIIYRRVRKSTKSIAKHVLKRQSCEWRQNEPNERWRWKGTNINRSVHKIKFIAIIFRLCKCIALQTVSINIFNRFALHVYVQITTSNAQKKFDTWKCVECNVLILRFLIACNLSVWPCNFLNDSHLDTEFIRLNQRDWANI